MCRLSDRAVATRWQISAEVREDQLFYLLRVYDSEGRFDETSLKSLTLLARESRCPTLKRRSASHCKGADGGRVSECKQSAKLVPWHSQQDIG